MGHQQEEGAGSGREQAVQQGGEGAGDDPARAQDEEDEERARLPGGHHEGGGAGEGEERDRGGDPCVAAGVAPDHTGDAADATPRGHVPADGRAHGRRGHEDGAGRCDEDGQQEGDGADGQQGHPEEVRPSDHGAEDEAKEPRPAHRHGAEGEEHRRDGAPAEGDGEGAETLAEAPPGVYPPLPGGLVGPQGDVAGPLDRVPQREGPPNHGDERADAQRQDDHGPAPAPDEQGPGV